MPVTKKLMKDIVTFCNQYIDNNNVVIAITKYSKFINVNFGVWNLNNLLITNHIGAINMYINNEEDLNKFKNDVSNRLPLLLEQVKND